MRMVVVFLLLSYSCGGQDGLSGLKVTLVGLRSGRGLNASVRGAGPQLTVAKHLLRDWVETKLSRLDWRGDEVALQVAVNAELRAAGLVCGYDDVEEKHCGGESFLGFIGEVRLFRRDGFLLLRSRLGIDCGFDDSVYLYQHTAAGWQRVWQNEQTDYSEAGYNPQLLVGIELSSTHKANENLLLTLGTRAWCSSVWQPHYYRVFRLGPSSEAELLLDESEFGVDGTLQGSVDSEKVLIQYSVHSVDGSKIARPTVRAYRENLGLLQRIAPLALSPRDFVEEWITHPWREVNAWSDAATRASLEKWHEKLPELIQGKEFIYPTKHCTSKPDLWQVGFDYYLEKDSAPVYLLVR